LRDKSRQYFKNSFIDEVNSSSIGHENVKVKIFFTTEGTKEEGNCEGENIRRGKGAKL